ncbi:MAG: hypothetical protein CM15mP96_3450 [Gammaproteobacteria bacterium]|nr:MAG: hypothetical protein CM15mP96_3450 [Gammaproteobacteria bacterium]
MDSIERLWEVIGHLNVGLCLDTCHTWAGGIPTIEAMKGFKNLLRKLILYILMIQRMVLKVVETGMKT